MRSLLVVIGLLVAAAWLVPWSAPPRQSDALSAHEGALDEESCAGCHEERQPGLMAQWRAGEHFRQEVTCEECHGDDHEAMFRAEGRVSANKCQGCHAKETLEFKKSAHARALRAALDCGRLQAQIPAMQRQGCLGCHSMGRGAGINRCNDCHGAHRFSAAAARRPEACGGCHMGPDHPHIEAWEASRHGIAFGATHDEKQAPTCATCHMPEGTHDVSSGITIGRAGSGAVLEGAEPPIPMRILDPEKAKEQREVMIARCTQCHTPRVARRTLEDADKIKREADRLVAQAARIVRGLHRDGLLDPMPEERTAHPTAGHALVLGGPMLYENQSNAERIFFDLAKFGHAITFKGAYHLSPDHTHWLGMARLKASIEELRAEERRLRGGR